MRQLRLHFKGQSTSLQKKKAGANEGGGGGGRKEQQSLLNTFPERFCLRSSPPPLKSSREGLIDWPTVTIQFAPSTVRLIFMLTDRLRMPALGFWDPFPVVEVPI